MYLYCHSDEFSAAIERWESAVAAIGSVEARSRSGDPVPDDVRNDALAELIAAAREVAVTPAGSAREAAAKLAVLEWAMVADQVEGEDVAGLSWRLLCGVRADLLAIGFTAFDRPTLAEAA